jgi:LysM repeat protein/peptidoglycan hydrolase-like protein with peptidoglycan-binding domain
VFTEWYRSRGHNFHITSSTAVDQKFVQGRNIFESISRIVDEIWNEYVQRQGRVEPFFTSYCNGTTAQCAGLTQWGTVTLANRGMTPIQILRHYYPNDINVVESLIFADVPESYPGAALRLGATGQNVEVMQRYLNRIRRNFPGIPVISNVNGVFDQNTLDAVRIFQRTFNLAQDGVIGPATWYQIVRIYVAVTNLAALNAEGTSLGITNTPPSSTLQNGSRGLDVITLQYVLSFVSEFYQDVPSVTQNGVFDAQTQNAVRAFQRTAGLPETGVVNQATWQRLWEFYFGVLNNSPPGIGGGGNDNSEVLTHVVQAGDTLFLLARRFGTTVEAIRNLNSLTGDLLIVGQRLLIPTSYPQTSSFNHTVVAGDTLFLLAQRFGTTVEAIRVLNNLNTDTLMIGQVLRIPGTAPQTGISYTVRAGDTLFLLGQRFGTTAEAIMNANHMTSSVLNIGQVITIPGNFSIYTVVAGDTLFLLALRFGTSVNALMALNGLTSSSLDIGQQLIVP